MSSYFTQGFMLGIAYLAPIGMQNLYVINTAIKRSKFRAYQVALITAFFDITLALACFFGIGALMEKSQTLKLIILLVGSIAVVYIGIQLMRSTITSGNEVAVNKSIFQVILACFMVTWANPQALIDGSLLLGGFKASLPYEGSSIFILGVCFASLSWFLGLTTVASIFKRNFTNKTLKIINIICGGVLIYYGLKLAFTFLQMIA